MADGKECLRVSGLLPPGCNVYISETESESESESEGGIGGRGGMGGGSMGGGMGGAENALEYFDMDGAQHHVAILKLERYDKND